MKNKMQYVYIYRRILFLAALAGTIAQAQVPTASHHQLGSPADSSNNLSVAVGKSIILDCATPVERVAVGLGGVVEATVVSPMEILVNGKAPGETSLIVWEKGGNREFFNVAARPGLSASSDRLDMIRRELNRQLPGQALEISGENGAVFLSGTAKDLTSSDRAVQIGSVAGKVVNLLNVEVPAP